MWRGTWYAVALVGVGLGLLETPRGMVPVAFPTIFALAMLLRFLRLPRTPPDPLLVAFVGTGAFGYLALSRPLSVLLGLLALMSAPVTLQAVRVATRREAHPEPMLPGVRSADVGEPAAARLTEAEVEGPLVGLDDRQLCRLWRESVWQLRGPVRLDVALRIVSLRQACLDELTRRHGPGVEAWLASGARASSGPERFLEPPEAS